MRDAATTRLVVGALGVAVVAARALLAVVFSAAASAKLADQREFRSALRSFGGRDALIPPLGLGVPLTELVIAAGLVPTPLSRLAALAAIGLLLVFSATIGAALVRGTTGECRCFGPLGGGRLGSQTLLRNLALAGLAAFVVAFGNDADVAAAGDGDELIVGSAASLAVLFGWFAARRRTRAVRTVGDAAPHQLLRTVSGDTIDLRAGGDRGTVLVFWDATCTACEQMTVHLDRLAGADRDDAPRLVVVSADTPARVRAAALPVPVVSDESGDLARALGVPGKPAAVLVDRRGNLASEVMLGTREITSALSDESGRTTVDRRRPR